ncbi:MAG: histidine kinase N-terminal 7TM domain-containing protein [Myxococcota bacterium]
MRFTLFALPPLLSAAVSLGLLWVARGGWTALRTPLSIVLGGLAIWSLGSAFEILLLDPEAQLRATQFSYLGIVSVTPALAVAAARATGRARWLSPRRLALLAIVPAMTLGLALTNEVHGLIWSEIRVDTAGPFPALAFSHGPWFWVHWSYSNVCLVAASVMLIQRYLRFWEEQRGLALAALCGISAPWLANLVYLAGWSPVPHLDLTPFAFTVTGLVLAWIFQRHGAFELVPVARRAVIESMADGVLVVDAAGHLLDANLAARRLLELPEDAQPGEALERVLVAHPQIARELAEGEVGRREISRMEGGERRTWELVLSTVRDRAGRVWGRVALIRDITRQVVHDQALQESEARKAAILDASLDMVIGVDVEGRIVEFNPAAVAAFGYARKDTIGRPLMKLVIPPALRGRFRSGFSSYLENAQPRLLGRRVELAAMRADGSEFPVEVAVVESKIGGQPVFTAFLRDLSDRKQAEEERRTLETQMRETQKLESLGVLAGGIAHDFNNLLTAVLGNAALARTEISEDSEAQATLQQIETAAQRAADLCTQMLAYSGRGRLAVQRVDLSALVEEMAHLLKASISKPVHLSLDLTPGLPSIEGDPTQLRQVAMNLITNASDAIGEDSGAITVRTGSTQTDRAYLVAHQWGEDLCEGDYVFLEVKDSGCGMDEATRHKIFEPFFTTKFTGRGLGMAAVLGIVRSHRGAIHVSSEPGQGSIFRVVLPATEEADEGVEASQGATRQQRVGTILLVDDEAIVRKVVARMLERSGYEVVVAATGGEGMEYFSARSSEFAAVVLDLTMPDIGGEEVLARIRRSHPTVPIVLMSGYTREDLGTRFEGKERVAFLHKPFRAPELLHAIDDAWRSAPRTADPEPDPAPGS